MTEILRKEKVVGKFVEFFGDGVSGMSLADRATIANMSPEYGATMGFFPIDDRTLEYLRLTGRTDDEVALVERYTKENSMFRTDAAPVPRRSPRRSNWTYRPSCLRWPARKRPQDRIALVEHASRNGKRTCRMSTRSRLPGGSNARPKLGGRRAVAPPIRLVRPNVEVAIGRSRARRRHRPVNEGCTFHLKHGSVAIAAITSCTNTSNPSVMIAAGLVAKKAAEKGLAAKPWVKTSIAPGSRVVTDYYEKSQLDKELAKIGFYTVGYGCTTCIGNSGPLPQRRSARPCASTTWWCAGVLSGNRNFEGRINPDVKANYLASPPLVVAYALAGTTDIDLTSDADWRRLRRPAGVPQGHLALRTTKYKP